MPGFDEFIPVPAHLEPPRQDADETLPSQLHPSYPFGRPRTVGRPVLPWLGGPRNLLGGVGRGEGGGESSGSGGGMGGGMGELWGGERWGRGEGWEELGLREVMEVETRKEVPAGIAVSSTDPSPETGTLDESETLHNNDRTDDSSPYRARKDRLHRHLQSSAQVKYPNLARLTSAISTLANARPFRQRRLTHLTRRCPMRRITKTRGIRGTSPRARV